MANNNNKNVLLVGAAVAAGIAGTLATFFWPERERGLTEKAKKTANTMLDGLKNLNAKREGVMSQDFVIGSVAGSLIAATTALLLAPKAGKDLLSDISKFFQKAPKLKMQAQKKVQKGVQKYKRASINEAKKVVRHAAAAKRVASRKVAAAPTKLKKVVQKKPASKHNVHKSMSR